MKKILITLTDEQASTLSALMAEVGMTTKTAFFTLLLGEKKLQRSKRPQGRPKKIAEADEYEEETEPEPDYTNDLPKIYPHYGRMLGQREYDDLMRRDKELKELGFGLP